MILPLWMFPSLALTWSLTGNFSTNEKLILNTKQMGSFSKSGQLEFQVHSWLKNFVLGRILQWAHENEGHSLPMVLLSGLCILITLSVFSMACGGSSMGKSGFQSIKETTSLYRESSSPGPATQTESGRMGFAESPEDFLLMELGFWLCLFKA